MKSNIGRQILKKICEEIELLITERNDFFLLPLFSGTVLSGFVDIFSGSFPPCSQIKVSLLIFEDIINIVKSLNDPYFNNIIESINFKKLLTYVGGHPRSIEVALDVIRRNGKESNDLLSNIDAILYKISEKYYKIDTLKDSTELLCYYITRKKINMNTDINLGDRVETIEELQRLGYIITKKSENPINGDIYVELPYFWFKKLINHCKHKNYQQLLIELCNSFEKDFSTGKNFEIFNVYFKCSRIYSLKLLNQNKITLKDIYNGGTFGECFIDINDNQINIFDYQFDIPENIEALFLKTQYFGDKKKNIYDTMNNRINLNEGYIYKNGDGAKYSDQFFFIKINQNLLLEIDEQNKYTTNPKGLLDLIEGEYNKVLDNKQKNFIFVYCTNGIVKENVYKEIIIIDHSNLKNYYGEAFSMKLLISPEKININNINESNRKDLMQIPGIGENIAEYIIKNKDKIKSYEDLKIYNINMDELKNYLIIENENEKINNNTAIGNNKTKDDKKRKKNETNNEPTDSNTKKRKLCKCKSGCKDKRCTCKNFNSVCSNSCECTDCKNNKNNHPKN
jgi:hypothetical protein